MTLLLRKDLDVGMQRRTALESNMYIVVLIVALTVVPVSCQIDCPRFNVSDLGNTNALITGGLIQDALHAVSGDPSVINVQLHGSHIVCLRNGRARDTYSGVSVVVNYTCTGSSRSECTGNPTLSQFEFECVTANPVRWAPSVGGSASDIITTPPNGTLSTTLRTDCGVCISPARSGFATITNNEQHCGCEYNSSTGKASGQQGVVTPISTVLTAATGVRMWSWGH